MYNGTLIRNPNSVPCVSLINIKEKNFNNSVYSILSIDFKFKRRTLFFTFNLILPSIVITISSIFGFILPPESGEKIGLRKNF